MDEPSVILGIVSLTPRLDYSQGNKWDTGLVTLDDLHKPGLDQIGFQELITEQMAWWSTHKVLAAPVMMLQGGGQQLNISGLSSGLYWVEIQSGTQKTTVKLVKP